MREDSLTLGDRARRLLITAAVLVGPLAVLAAMLASRTLVWVIAGFLIGTWLCAWSLFAARRFGAAGWIKVRLPRRVYDIDGLPVGLRAGGRRWRLSLLENSVLIGGTPGSGKSSLLNALLALLSRRFDVRFHGVDHKGGVELWPWRSRMDSLAINVEDTVVIVDRLVEIIEEGLVWLRELGERHIWYRLSARNPVHVLVIDEAAEALADARVARQVGRIVRLGRAVGVIAIIATQKPTADAVPTEIRDNCGVRIAYRTMTAEATKSILGVNPPDGAPLPTQITHRQRGRAVVLDETGFHRVQTAWVSDAGVRAAVLASRDH